MVIRYISVVTTALSFIGLQVWTELFLDRLIADGKISKNISDSKDALELFLRSHTTIALLASFVLSAYVLVVLSLKALFFGDSYAVETRRLVERLASYIICKGAFLPFVVPATFFQGVLWTIWLIVLCTLKMFQALARDQLERLNACPSSTPWTYFRVYSALLTVLAVDLFGIKLSLMMYNRTGFSLYLLLLFEPCSIAFETLQALLVHGFQLLDIWIGHVSVTNLDCQSLKFLDSMIAGSLLEWKGLLNRNLGFFLDMATLVMALGHYLQIWLLHGMTFHLVNMVLIFSIRAVLREILNRSKGYIKQRAALDALHGALPDATSEELQAYDDECAICREPMAKAKKLHCNHIFHLGCLRSWLDQGLNGVCSCPTCRKPLFVGRNESETNPSRGEVSSNEQLARQIDRRNNPAYAQTTGLFPTETPNSIGSGPWRNSGLDPSWLRTWSDQGVDVAGPSAGSRSVGPWRVQMMMRHLASAGEGYTQTALDDASWGLWPPSQASNSSTYVPPGAGGRTGGMRLRTVSRAENMASILSMAETVREVLPHVPDELIFQDLRRTNSIAVTVTNLLRM